MSFIVSVLQGMGLLTQVHEHLAKKHNPFTAIPEGTPTRVVTLAALSEKAEGQSAHDQLHALKDSAGLTLGLRDIFRIGKLEEPKHGVSILRLALMAKQLLESKGRQATIDELTIEVAGVGMSINDVVEDAVRHDEMLDLYDEAVGIRSEHLAQGLEDDAKRIADEIAALQERIASRKVLANALRDAYGAWRQQKRTIEEGWAEALGLLVDKDVVSVTDLNAPNSDENEVLTAPIPEALIEEPDEPSENNTAIDAVDAE